jgi:hypothetical protein
MRWRSAWLAASSLALALTACGGREAAPQPKPPRIPPSVAQLLAAEADAVAAAARCSAHDAAAKLQKDTINAISRVPTRYREQLMSAANDLAARVPACPPPAQRDEDHGHGKGRGKHGKHGKHGEGD